MTWIQCKLGKQRFIWLTLRKISFFLTMTGPVAGKKEYGSPIIYLKKYNSLLFWVGSGWGVLIMLHYGRADELASSISISCWLFSLLQCIRHSSRVINDPNFSSQDQTSLHEGKVNKLEDKNKQKKVGWQCVTVPKMLNHTDTFFRYQIFSLPIPVLFSVPNFSHTSCKTFFRY